MWFWNLVIWYRVTCFIVHCRQVSNPLWNPDCIIPIAADVKKKKSSGWFYVIEMSSKYLIFIRIQLSMINSASILKLDQRSKETSPHRLNAAIKLRFKKKKKRIWSLSLQVSAHLTIREGTFKRIWRTTCIGVAIVY